MLLLGLQELHVEVHILGDRASFLNPLLAANTQIKVEFGQSLCTLNLHFVSCFKLLDKLVADLEHLEEVLLATPDYGCPTRDRLLIHGQVVVDSELSAAVFERPRGLL